MYIEIVCKDEHALCVPNLFLFGEVAEVECQIVTILK